MKLKIVLGVCGLVGFALLVWVNSKGNDRSVIRREQKVTAQSISQLSAADVLSASSVEQQVSLSQSSQTPTDMKLIGHAEASVENVASSASKSSLSYPRVDPSEQIKHFLHAMDETAVPKVATRDVKRDELFDYDKAAPEELKARALNGDPYAALDYAKYVSRNQVWVMDERGQHIPNPDKRKRDEAAQEVREFLVRAMSGGLMEAPIALSRIYSGPWMYQVEALAWRKIAFAMGESERFDCLRDSTTCVVKDFNNLHRDEFFYPCVSMAYDQCSQATYEDATLLALQYLNSFDLAVKGPHSTAATSKK